MKLATAINEATKKELADLAAFLHAELEMEAIDFESDRASAQISTESVAQAIMDWSRMQLNPPEKGA